MSRLGAHSVLGYVSGKTTDRIQRFRHFAEISSTNSWLLNTNPPLAGKICVAVADHQTAGRGRLERRWYTQPGSGVCLSLAYRFERSRTDIAGLTIAVGVGVADALRQLGAAGITLKWPNDVMSPAGKLAGILAETRSGGEQASTVVIGLGLNVSLAELRACNPGYPWLAGATDLESCCADVPPRENIVAALLDGMTAALVAFDHDGLDPFITRWRAYDHFQGKPVVVELADGTANKPAGNAVGVAAGIDESGAMILKTASGTQRILSGSVRLDSSADAA